MKKKIITLILCLATLFGTLSLSSCYLLDSDNFSGLGTGENSPQNSTVIVENGGDNYDITINSSESTTAIATSKALLSSVSIRADFKKRSSFGQSTYLGTQFGAGVIYKMEKSGDNAYDAYVITNYHVVYNESSSDKNNISETIDVFLYGHETFTNLSKQEASKEDLATYKQYAIPATYVGGSMEKDIAILKIEGNATLAKSNARAVDIANSDDIAILDTAIAIGYPEGHGISATLGHVSVDSEYIDLTMGTTAIELRVIRTDAAVNEGNSGGGLFNSKGELIGIVNAKIIKDNVDGIGYAIPSNVAKKIADNIIYHCDGTEKTEPKICQLGIMLQATDFRTEYDTKTGILKKRETIVVQSMAKNSAVLGKLEVNDVLLSITVDGKEQTITRLHHPIDALIDAREGSKITFKILRNNKEMTVEHTASVKPVEYVFQN